MEVSTNSDYMHTTMIPKALVLVEPNNFKINPETIKDNQYMQVLNESSDVLHAKVLNEHKNYQKELKKNKVDFKVYKQRHNDAYDSIFACDWFGSIKNEDFPEGILFVFPVKWPTRRLEKNYDLIDDLKKENKYFEDLSYFEERDLALESFGTMSLDFHNRIVYINLSERCHLEPAHHFINLLNKYSEKGEYKLRLIESSDPNTAEPCFHTGLYLAFIDSVVFFCKDFVTDKKDAEKLVEEFSRDYQFKYDVVLLSYQETCDMCANVLEVKLADGEKNGEKGKTGLVVSRVSYKGYSEENLTKLREKFEFVVVDMDTINLCAGGSLRCMVNMIY